MSGRKFTVSAGELQIGGGITDKNAKEWLNAGASKVHMLQISSTLING
jgi:phosphoribosylformimino-5-aminoimidazole carboxamide ribonucleotide (ProFAR) isomerase